MRKHFADIVTACRILGSVLLLCFPAFSVEFYIIYIICGFSDICTWPSIRPGIRNKPSSPFSPPGDISVIMPFSTVTVPNSAAVNTGAVASTVSVGVASVAVTAVGII